MSATIHDNQSLFSQLLMRDPSVSSVSYEFPGFFSIETAKGEFYLGTANGNVGWHDLEAEITGETDSEQVLAIAKDFLNWLDQLDNK